MNSLFLLFFSLFLIIIGATGQMRGDYENTINIQKQFMEKASLLFIFGIESAVDSKNKKVAAEIEAQLEEDTKLDECSLIQKQELKTLKNNKGVEKCLNLNDTIDKLDNLVINVTKAFGIVKDVYQIALNISQCTLIEGSNFIGCVKDGVILLKHVAQNRIMVLTNLYADIVSVILTTLEDALNCLSKSDSVTNKLSTIANNKCQSENKQNSMSNKH